MTAMRLDDTGWLDAQYNNRARVPAAPQHLAAWAERSAAARAALGGAIDLRYGSGPDDTLDVFPSAMPGPAPVLFFIHGGWWRSLAKSDHSFVAPPFCAAGACVVVPDYTLCPATTIPGIERQMREALAWTWRHIAQHGGDPSRIVVAGHSAGGQLAAMVLRADWPALAPDLPAALVKDAFTVSGLFELESLRRTPFLQDSLQLTPEQVAQMSPALLPAPRQGRLFATVGGDESEAFLLQQALVRERWGEAVVPVAEVLPGLNHFSVIETLADPASRLHALARQLLETTR